MDLCTYGLAEVVATGVNPEDFAVAEVAIPFMMPKGEGEEMIIFDTRGPNWRDWRAAPAFRLPNLDTARNLLADTFCLDAEPPKYWTADARGFYWSFVRPDSEATFVLAYDHQRAAWDLIKTNRLVFGARDAPYIAQHEHEKVLYKHFRPPPTVQTTTTLPSLHDVPTVLDTTAVAMCHIDDTLVMSSGCADKPFQDYIDDMQQQGFRMHKMHRGLSEVVWCGKLYSPFSIAANPKTYAVHLLRVLLLLSRKYLSGKLAMTVASTILWMIAHHRYGRAYIHPLWACIADLRHPSCCFPLHATLIYSCLRAMVWGLVPWNNTSLITWSPPPVNLSLPSLPILYADASAKKGRGGVVCFPAATVYTQQEFLQAVDDHTCWMVSFKLPSWTCHSQPLAEFYVAYRALLMYNRHTHRALPFIFAGDCTSALYALHGLKAKPRLVHATRILKKLYQLLSKNSIRVFCGHIPGRENCPADLPSRMEEDTWFTSPPDITRLRHNALMEAGFPTFAPERV